MANFAKLNDDNIVIAVNAVSNDVINNLPFPESEPIGVQFLTEWSGGYTNWKQTSINSNFRKHAAGIYYIYDAVLDAFIPPKPYPSWLLNTEKCIWNPPVPRPNDGKQYIWNETTQSWDLVDDVSVNE
jgi:hypothetical protein